MSESIYGGQLVDVVMTVTKWSCFCCCYSYVRQGVLYGLGMMMCATPRHVLLGELSLGMVEAVSWMKEVAKEDPDQKARSLAAHALSVFSTHIKEHE